MNEKPQSNGAWEDRLVWFKTSQEYRNLDRIDGEPMEFEWNISQDSTRCSSVKKSKSYRWDQMKHQRISQEGLSSCRCSTTSHGDQETTKLNASQMLNSFLYMPEELEQDNSHFSVLVQRKSGILSVKIVHKVNGTKLRSWWCLNSAKADTQSSGPRIHCPVVSSEAKTVETCRFTIVPIWKRLKLFFRTITSVNQLSLHGALAEMCEEYESFHDWTGKPLWEGSRVPYSCQPWSRQTCLWIVMTVLTKIICCKNTGNELKSYHNKTNWANFVWMQDSSMLLKSDSISWRKILHNSHNSQMQWPVVSTLCQETKKHQNRMVGSEGTPELGPCWKLQPVACKVKMELRSESCL